MMQRLMQGSIQRLIQRSTKRAILFIALFLLPIFMLFAAQDEPNVYPPNDVPKNIPIEEPSEKKEDRFILGAGITWTNSPRIWGGHIEFGVLLYRKVLFVRSHLILRGGGLSENGDYTIFTLSGKLLLGRNTWGTAVYTYLEGGGGIFGNQTKKIFEDPFALTFSFGAGFEIDPEDFGFYFEVGYMGQRVNMNYPVSGVILQAGWRMSF